MGTGTLHVSIRPQACRCMAHCITQQSRNAKALSGAGDPHQLFKQYRGTTGTQRDTTKAKKQNVFLRQSNLLQPKFRYCRHVLLGKKGWNVLSADHLEAN